MILRARHFEFRFPRPALVMGIVNVTPDSFSDGGQYLDPDAAVDHAFELEAEGADLVDIGGESTRPSALPVSGAEELRRVLPVIRRLAGRLRVPMAIDTMKVEVAREALAAGAALVNDVGANRSDELMGRLVAGTGAGYVCMHMQGTPQTMQKKPVYGDVLSEVDAFFRERMQHLAGLGVQPEQIVLDVGIGFGKTLEHNLQLLARLGQFRTCQRPLLLGVSRKSFIGALLGLEVQARLPASLACACLAVCRGAHIIRTHDVAVTVQALRMAEAIDAAAGPPCSHGSPTN